MSTIWDTGIEGPPGPPGPQGPAPLLRVFSGFIQWSYVGSGVWNNLIAVSDLVGPPGTGAQGPIGPIGPAGANGTPGSVIYSGSGAPVNTTGIDGDYYVDLASAFFYGPKAGGVWPGSPVDLRGGASGVNYGNKSITNNSAVIAKLAAADPTLVSNSDYTQITGIFDAIPSGQNRGITQQANTFTIARTGVYQIDMWASLSTNQNNNIVAFKFSINGVIQGLRRPRVKLNTLNDVYALAAHGQHSLAAGDVIGLHIACTVACNVTISDLLFTAFELR